LLASLANTVSFDKEVPVSATAVPAARSPFSATTFAILGPLAIGLAVAGAIVGSPWLLALWLAPDLALVAGMGRDLDPGQLHPRAVPAYNAVHALPGPIAVIAAGAVLSTGALAIGLMWLSHVLLDRSIGYGLRTRAGWQRG
jgi:hypothetical protein